jgi:hypothetical protein
VWRLRSVVVQQVAGCLDLGDRVGVPMDDRPPAVFDRLGAAGLRDLQLTLGLVGEIAREVAGSPQAVPS